MPSPTINDVAKTAGVSIATVSRVYNSPASVREETKKKVLAAAQALNYAPNLAARALTLRKTNMIGVILPDLGGDFFSELIRSIDQVAGQHGYHILISASHSHRNEAEILLRFMSQGMVDGLMLMVPVLGRLRLAGLEELSLPIALLNLPPENKIQCLHINVDNYRGAYLMTKHLLDHGYRPLAMIRGPAGNFDADERERGFRAALTEYHLPQDAIHFERGDFMRRSGYFAMSRLLSLPQRPRAVFAANDDMAVGALEAARQLGVNVPGEVALAGFDDIAAAGYLRPALTTVHMPIAELGTMATQKLIEAIQSEAARENASQKFILPTGLVIRESCGCSFQNVMAEKRERR